MKFLNWLFLMGLEQKKVGNEDERNKDKGIANSIGLV
jgi:hypothetical protein